MTDVSRRLNLEGNTKKLLQIGGDVVHSQVTRKTRARNAIKQQEKINIDFVILSIRNTSPFLPDIVFAYRKIVNDWRD